MFLQETESECLTTKPYSTTDKADTLSDKFSEVEPSRLSKMAGNGEYHLEFSLEPGFFQQDEARGRDNKKLGTVYEFPESFGLKRKAYDTDESLRETIENPTDWQRFDHKLRQMNKEAAKQNTEYVLLYAARHGQGYHNIAEEKVGTYNWENPSKLSKIPLCLLPQFEDAHLTPIGEDQADTISRIFQDLIETQHLPTPTAYYTSPLHRACSTALRTWSPLDKTNTFSHPFHPTIHELLREQMYNHNCNKRSPLAQIQSTFPSFNFEPDSHGPPTKTDTLFSPSYREQDPQVADRAYLALSDILLPTLRQPSPPSSPTSSRPPQYISLTSHAGFLSGLYRVLGYSKSSIPRFPTGIIVPLLVKVQVKAGPRPSPAWPYAEKRAVEKEKDDRNLEKDHTSRGKELDGKGLDEILKEIFDSGVYDRVKGEMKVGKWT